MQASSSTPGQGCRQNSWYQGPRGAQGGSRHTFVVPLVGVLDIM